MKEFIISAVAILLLGNACKEAGPRIKKEKMIALLWDMQVAQTYLKRESIENNWDSITLESQQFLALRRICSLQRILPSNFQKDMTYYQSHPYQFEKILQEVEKLANDYSKGMY